MIRTKNTLKIVVLLSLLSFLGAFGIGCACFKEATVEAPAPPPAPAPVVKAPPPPPPPPPGGVLPAMLVKLVVLVVFVLPVPSLHDTVM